MKVIGTLVLFLVPLALLVGLAACGTSSVKQTPEDRRYQGEADFNPWSAHDFPVTVAETTRNWAKPKEVDRSMQSRVSTTPAKAEAGLTKRLQILTTTNRDVADATAGGAREKLNVTFQLKFEAPYYRVRSAECFPAKDADSLLNVALQNGFPNAWLIPCN